MNYKTIFNSPFCRFLIVGILTVLLDFLVYTIFHRFFLLDINLAKGTSFIVGTVFAFKLNQLWTFNFHKISYMLGVRFLILYGLTLNINMIVNHLLNQNFNIYFSFLGATLLSAMLNFCGMKWFVFIKKY